LILSPHIFIMSTPASKTRVPATPRTLEGAKQPTIPKPKNSTPKSRGFVNSSNNQTVAATPDEQSREIAATLQFIRTSNTNSTYASMITHVVEWFGANRPHCLGDDGKLLLPIPCMELLEFFSHLAGATNTQLAPSQITDDMPEPVSTSTVDGYRRAIVDLYTNANMVMDPDTKLALTRAMDGCDKSITELGCEPEVTGVHSIRKGSSTIGLGQVGGPTSASVFLRMGQSLGQLKDRYIFACEGADQLKIT
jgi:hypothetical protein